MYKVLARRSEKKFSSDWLQICIRIHCPSLSIPIRALPILNIRNIRLQRLHCSSLRLLRLNLGGSTVAGWYHSGCRACGRSFRLLRLEIRAGLCHTIFSDWKTMRKSATTYCSIPMDCKLSSLVARVAHQDQDIRGTRFDVGITRYIEGHGASRQIEACAQWCR